MHAYLFHQLVNQIPWFRVWLKLKFHTVLLKYYNGRIGMWTLHKQAVRVFNKIKGSFGFCNFNWMVRFRCIGSQKWQFLRYGMVWDWFNNIYSIKVKSFMYLWFAFSCEKFRLDWLYGTCRKFYRNILQNDQNQWLNQRVVWLLLSKL